MAGTAGVLGRLRAVVVAVMVIVAGFVLGGVVTVLGLFAAASALDTSISELPLTTVTVLGLVGLQGIGFSLTTFGYLALRGVSFRSFIRTRVPTLRDVGWMVGGYVLVLVLVFTVAIVISQTSAPTATRTDQAALQDPGTLLWLLPLAFLLIGPGEELLFRGVVQGRLRESFGPTASILLASAGFAPAHVLALSGSVAALAVSIAVLFVPALVLGTAYERTNNLLVPILIHGAYDATLFGLAYVVAENGMAGLLVPF